MYKARNLYFVNFEDTLSVPLGKSRDVMSDGHGRDYKIRKEGAGLRKLFRPRKRNGNGRWSKVERGNWGATNVMYLCAHSPVTSAHS